jgi:integral membrane sensor domain MASE1
MNTSRLSFRFAYALLFFTVLAVTGALGLAILRHSPANFPTLWPATGVAVAGLLFWGPRYWPVVWAVGTLVSLTSRGLPIAAVMGVGDAATALLACFLLTRTPGFDAALPRRADVVAFVCLGAVVGTLPSPTIGVGIQYLAGLVPAAGVASYWSTWWVGNLAGVLLVTPPLLLWRSSWFSDLRASGRLLEALAVVMATGGLAASAVWIRSSVLVMVLHTLVPLPLLLWASLRLGAFPASTVALLAASGSIVAWCRTGRAFSPPGRTSGACGPTT